MINMSNYLRIDVLAPSSRYKYPFSRLASAMSLHLHFFSPISQIDNNRTVHIFGVISQATINPQLNLLDSGNASVQVFEPLYHIRFEVLDPPYLFGPRI